MKAIVLLNDHQDGGIDDDHSQHGTEWLKSESRYFHWVSLQHLIQLVAVEEPECLGDVDDFVSFIHTETRHHTRDDWDVLDNRLSREGEEQFILGDVEIDDEGQNKV